MAAKQPHFSPKQVAQSLEVSESSVKRWCDRGAIPVVRTLGGHRRITLEGLEKFLSTSNRCQIMRPEILGFPVLSRSLAQKVPGIDDPRHQQFREAMATGDEESCRRMMREQIVETESRSEALESLICDAMHGLGEAWECDELAVYQERRACGIALRLINEIRMELPPVPKDAPVAIGGAPAGDPYEVPSAMVELALRETGWQAVNLGCNLPLESFQKAVEVYRPKLFWLSVSAIQNTQEFIKEQTRLADSLSDDVTLIVGGRGLCDRVRPHVRYTAHCGGIRHLVELADMLRVRP